MMLCQIRKRLTYSQSATKQPVTQRKLIINNIKFCYFITLLKIKFLVCQLASKKIPTCIPINFVLMLAPTETFLRLALVAVNYFDYSCGLSTATKEYSCPSVCVCVCLSVYTITQQIMVQST